MAKMKLGVYLLCKMKLFKNKSSQTEFVLQDGTINTHTHTHFSIFVETLIDIILYPAA